VKTVSAGAIYARISSDVEGSGLGVARQVQDCRRLAQQLGWTVAEVYQDNDFSAYWGKKRPRVPADVGRSSGRFA
jgi:site-specific DNA recombinase